MPLIFEEFSFSISEFLYINNEFEITLLYEFLIKHGFSKKISMDDQEFWYNFVFLTSNINQYVDLFTSTDFLYKSWAFSHVNKASVIQGNYMEYFCNMFETSLVFPIMIKDYKLTYMECFHLQCLTSEIKDKFPNIEPYLTSNFQSLIQTLSISFPFKVSMSEKRMYIISQLKEYDTMIKTRRERKKEMRNFNVDYIDGYLDIELVYHFGIKDYKDRRDLIELCKRKFSE